VSELSFWFPLFLIFASALLAAVIKRYTKDPCLKIFHRSFVFLKLRDGRWIYGDLFVYSNSLEVRYRTPAGWTEGYEKLSYVLYENNLDSVDRVLRPSPRPGTRARQEWDREIERLQNPSAFRQLSRKIRNLFNMLRDAFAQAIVIIFGTVRRRTRLANVQVDEGKVGEMGRTLVSAVANAYEPILEEYLGHPVVVETAVTDAQIVEQSGVLQEYSAKYLLARDVEFLRELPPQMPTDLASDQFDVVFARQWNLVRHLAKRTAVARKHPAFL
jgi:hypothetical protein